LEEDGHTMNLRNAVLFAFDDDHVAEWVAAAPLFREVGARVTFFVSVPDRLTAEQLEGLRFLRQEGHAIGCHGLRHLKAVDTVARDGLEAYLRDEIHPAIAALAKAGFAPTAFAYPCSQNNAQTDAALLRHFRHLRTGARVPGDKRLVEVQAIFVPVSDLGKTGCLVGTGMDYAGTARRPDYVEQVCEALDRARQQGEAVVLYAHNIRDDGPGHHIRPSALHAVLAHAKTIGLPAISFDDLP
jgi:peptidoglycan/xylan/chitin deacetylase (PgdA/CDA1 family)